MKDLASQTAGTAVESAAVVDGGARQVELIERGGELAHIRDAVDRLRDGHGDAVLVEAAAGLGKTSLLRAARDMATAERVAVCSTTAHELEFDLPFGVLRQLFARTVSAASPARRRRLFGEAAGLARRLLTESGLATERPGPDTASRVQHSLFWFLINLSAERPVLLCVDDVHWADDPSLRFLAHVLSHLDELPVGLLFTMRPLEETHRSLVLQRLCGENEITALRPRPLSEEAVRDLVGKRLGRAPPALGQVFHEATGGNPFYLLALIEDLKRDARPTLEIDPAVVRETAPRSVSRAVLTRLASLPGGSIEFAIAVAVLGDGQPFLDAVRLAGLEVSQAAEVHDALVRSSILRSGDNPAFVHPIVRAAAYAELGPRERAVWHGRAAELLSGDDGHATRIALHLMLSDPVGDQTRVGSLRLAAMDAMQQGAPDIASRFLERAYVEPPSSSSRGHVLLELGMAEAMAGAPGCREHLRAALDTSADAAVRGQAALTLGRLLALAGEIPDAVAVMDGAVDDLWANAPDLALAVEAELLNTALLDTRTGAMSRSRAPRLMKEAETRSGLGALDAWAFLASLAALDGQPAEVVSDMSLRAIADDQLVLHAGPESLVAYLPIFALAFVDRFKDAMAALDVAVAEARQRGSAPGFVNARILRSHVNYRRGAVAEAEADGRDILAVPDLPFALTVAACGFLADALLERGELDEALALVQIRPGPHAAGFVLHSLHTRGRVLLACGRAEDALTELLDCGRRLEAIGTRNPATVPWRSAAAEVLLACGEREDAFRLASEELELARALGGRRAVGISLITAGRCAKGERSISMLREATEVLAGSEARLEHARALTALGAALRRTNHRTAARVPLRAGLDLAVRCGATVLADEARVELKATGARPRRELLSGRAALTPSELRVAQMASSGMTRAAIAQALFVTPKTVDAHLGHAYTKLGIASRRDLSAAIAPTAPG